jgi:preprotein translocase subunit SecB
MMPEMRYPLKLDNVFFSQLQFTRIPQMPDDLELPVGIQAKVVDQRFPERLEVHLKAETADDSPLAFRVVVVGLFSLIEGASEPDRDIIPDFVTNRAFYILWAYIDHVVTQTTTSMGMKPIRLQPPIDFLYESPTQLI